jgi:ubiquinone/menaquinone biosynthesis C-methylase UbiE
LKHREIVQTEFTRQAESFAASVGLAAPEVTDRIGAALRELAPSRVLDFACGPGVLLPTLAARARQVVGLDLTAETLRVARRSAARAGMPALVQADAERAPFVSASFDAVVLRLAIHHMSRPEAVLAEARRLLRVGGRLLVLDILTSSDPATAALHNALERLRDPSHAAFVPEPELARSIAAAGFSVLESGVWRMPRRFSDWAAVISDPVRMGSLEIVLRQLARAGITAGIDLREEADVLSFTYTWAFLVAEAA